jgi:hypothetical protein
MKSVFFILMLMFNRFYASAQIVSYAELFCTANEIVIKDSLHFKACPTDMIQLDSNLAKQVFAPIYHSAENKNGGNVNWGVAGKISKHPQYDLLLLVEKNETDTNYWHHVLHLVSMDKRGNYLASFGLYISRSTSYTSYNTSSFLYPDLSISQYTKVNTGHQGFGGSKQYRIQNDGKFVYYAKN